MRVLSHIHTFNDADILDQTIEALLRQTRPVDGILVVDNASTDGTVERISMKEATVLRHGNNVGTSGAVVTGLRFALEHGYDWTWVFDADSVPEPDALQKLLDLYAGWPPELQEETAFLACLPRNACDGKPVHGQIFTRYGIDVVRPPRDQRYYPCHVTIWSGCLYRSAVVRQIGLPNPNYVLDAGDCEYGYQVMRAGYKGFILQDATVKHNIRGTPSFEPVKLKLGPLTVTLLEVPPIRCYYGFRNTLYFALYEIGQGRAWLLLRTTLGLAALAANFLVRPWGHAEQIVACIRGAWHGVTGNMEARY